MDTIRVDGSSCIRCGRCVKVCPSQIFVQEKAGAAVTLHKPELYRLRPLRGGMSHGAVEHADFPAERCIRSSYAGFADAETGRTAARRAAFEPRFPSVPCRRSIWTASLPPPTARADQRPPAGLYAGDGPRYAARNRRIYAGRFRPDREASV
ncbi:MAG: ferredoxin family protein [Alistipes sp.]